MTRSLAVVTTLLFVAGSSLWLPSHAGAELLVTNFFFNTVDLYDDQTGQLIQSGFFAPPAGPQEVLGLSGIAVSPSNHQVYVSSRFYDRIYVFDGATGQPLPSAPGGQPGLFKQLATGSQPAGLALDSTGNLYVANNGGTSVDVFDSAAVQINTISDGGQSLSLPSGLTVDGGGDLFITTLGGTNVLRYSAGSLSQFAAPNQAGLPYVPNGVLVGPGGDVYVADVFSNGIFKYAPDGAEITGPGGAPFIEVALPNIPPSAIHPNAPSGLAFDENGDLLVAVLGPTNPFNPPYEVHGALLRYSSTDGSLLQELGLGLPPASGVVLITVPEPATTVSLGLLGCGAVAWLAWCRRRRLLRR